MNTDDQFPDRNSEKSTELQTPGERLKSEINALQHELRRVRDGLERSGSVSQELEQRAIQLSENIELCEKELKQNQQQQAKGPG